MTNLKKEDFYKTKLDILKYVPEYARDSEIFIAPFISFVSFAIGKKSFRDDFKKDTGLSYSPPATAIEEIIDSATGHDRIYVKKFIKWCSEGYWKGMED